MTEVLAKLDGSQHCPECGAQLHFHAQGMTCAHCGFEDASGEEELFFGSCLRSLSEGLRFHQGDDRHPLLNQAA